MYTVSCEVMGIAGCDFVGKGESIDVAARKLLNHIIHAHKKVSDKILESQSKDEFEAKIKEKVTSDI